MTTTDETNGQEEVNEEADPVAGTKEVSAFTQAATAIEPVTEGMRLRVLKALDALMLPPPVRAPLIPPELAKTLMDNMPDLITGLVGALAGRPQAYGVTTPVPSQEPTEAPEGYTKLGIVMLPPEGDVPLFMTPNGTAVAIPAEWVKAVTDKLNERARQAKHGETIATPPPKEEN